MNKVFLFFLLSSWTAISGFSQGLVGSCGTTAADNYLIRERMMSNREAWQGRAVPRTGAPVYVPVTYWLIAKNDGTGRLPFKNVVDNLCALNKIYASVNMVFYLKATNNINNSFIYDDPSSTLGEAYINQFMLSNKNAINIFVANAARASDPGVLAFYSPAGDYIVTNKLYVNADGTTLAHEIGHYFSLAHTFFGWEGTVYNTVTSNCTKPTPTLVGNGVLVEFVDRNKAGTGGKKHCEQSADGFCDTPADYNLGLGFQGPGCSYSGCTKDPEDAILDPSEVNLMSYFLSCIRDFTTDQINAITKDYLSAGRNYLRNPVYTPKAEITEQVQYIKPLMDNAPLGYDTVAFDWADVPNATQYIFEVAENTGFNINNRVFLISRSDTTLANFKKSRVYYWRVYPFNQNSFCVVPRVISFTTPSWTVASENIENPSIESYIYQTQGEECILHIETDQAQTVDLQWFNANGTVLKEERIRLASGIHSVSISNLVPGLYFYRIVGSDFRTNTRKFIKS